MKQILFIRHAKSSWDYTVDDFHRPLMEKGIKRAQNIALQLISTGLDLDSFLWFSSPANRALHTATIFAKQFNFIDRINLVPNLYTFSFQELHRSIESLNPESDSIVLFGHNPAFTLFVNQFGSKVIENMQTASVVLLKFETDSWQNLQPGKTQFYINPNDYNL